MLPAGGKGLPVRDLSWTALCVRIPLSCLQNHPRLCAYDLHSSVTIGSYGDLFSDTWTFFKSVYMQDTTPEPEGGEKQTCPFILIP